MTCIPVREPEQFRPSRWSAPEGGHFLTLCVDGYWPGLATTLLSSQLHAAAHLLSLDHHWHVRTASVLPHHVHLLITLPEHSDLAEVVHRFKQRLEPCLRRCDLRWQRGYFDRRMHPTEDYLPAFLYVFRCPYRDRLIAPSEPWPGYFCAESDWEWFSPLTRMSCQFPEWLLQWRLYAVADRTSSDRDAHEAPAPPRHRFSFLRLLERELVAVGEDE
jgi:REP element-mobilizing transposase RayT